MSEPVETKATSNNIVSQLFSRVHSAGLNIYRIGFGIIMIWEAWRFLYYDKVFSHWIQPTFLFKYPLFAWVQPLPEAWMYVLVVAIGVLGILIALGLAYRSAIVLMFFGFSYIFLLDASRYLNHFYFVCLLSFLMMFMPLNRGWSLDALWFNKSLRENTMPKWVLWLLRFQIGIPYFFGGVAKLNRDWLQGEPMHMWLTARSDFPVLGLFADKLWFAYLFSYGGLFLDLLAVPLLLWKPTRLFIFLVLVFFHFINNWIFSIGIFPWMMLVATTVFFKPDWPIKMYQDMKDQKALFLYVLSAACFGVMGGYFSKTWQFVPIVISIFTGLVCLWLFRDQFVSSKKASTSSKKAVSKKASSKKPVLSSSQPDQTIRVKRLWQGLIISFLAIWVLVQTLLPLRHWAYPTWVHWTDQGNYFAWRMKLRNREGNVRFWVTSSSGGSVELTSKDIGLTEFQSLKILSRPDLIHQAAYYIQDKFMADGYGDVQVYARNQVSLNGREPAILVDPYVDLTEIPIRAGKFTPVLELDKPLRPEAIETSEN